MKDTKTKLYFMCETEYQMQYLPLVLELTEKEHEPMHEWEIDTLRMHQVFMED